MNEACDSLLVELFDLTVIKAAYYYYYYCERLGGIIGISWLTQRGIIMPNTTQKVAATRDKGPTLLQLCTIFSSYFSLYIIFVCYHFCNKVYTAVS